jgi:hypothetical protein
MEGCEFDSHTTSEGTSFRSRCTNQQQTSPMSIIGTPKEANAKHLTQIHDRSLAWYRHFKVTEIN